MNTEKVVFFDDDHSYWHGNRQLRSVGSTFKDYFPFQETYWLAHGVLKELYGDEYVEHYRSFKRFSPPKNKLFTPFLLKTEASTFILYKNRLSQVWGRKRTESAYNGTKFHKVREDKAYHDKVLKNPFSGVMYPVIQRDKLTYDNESVCMDLSQLEDGAHIELLVFDLKLGIAGQVDEVYIETIDNVRYIDINDHKTNEKKPSNSAPSRCLAPFNDEYASKVFSYSLQINMYARLLENHGFKTRNLAFTHYMNYNFDKSTQFLVKSLPQHVDILLEDIS